MPTLPKDLRSKLEKAVLAAREEATKGAEAALIALGVGDAKKPVHLDTMGETSRRKLRARGRQAGDVLRPDDSQETGHLVQECAYEHWHRMLFARFLAENDLLRHPEMSVAVSLEECEELAREEGLDLWELAARFAQHMLPEVFRQDDPVLQVRLPTESRNRLTAILNELPPAVFTADDSLGWTYQFWQTKRKKEVNESGVKIGADELAPVTQLFTEDYMVEFLLHNTLGAWWAGKLGPLTASNEEEARAKAAMPACDGIRVNWGYLRFIQDEETNSWKPAAGIFEGWPREAKAITFLDPCMGSGHFLIFALPILARLRMEEEGLSAAQAVTAVLRDNIHGLELDPRCCQIGAFNLALTAWKLAGYQSLPPLHIACCGLAPRAKLTDWLKLAEEAAAAADSALAPDVDLLGIREETLLSQKLKAGMERLYRLFEQAPILGSLINPRSGEGDLLVASFREIEPILEKALAWETSDETAHEMAVTARGLTKAAEILASQFVLVATNVPYLGRGKQNESLKLYCERAHFAAKTELATCFVERCLDFCSVDGTAAVVTPQNWLFLASFEDLRKSLLSRQSWNAAVRLGRNAFQDMNFWAATTSMLIVSRTVPNALHKLLGLDADYAHEQSDKALALICQNPFLPEQHKQLHNPDGKVMLTSASSHSLLSSFCRSYQGIKSGDDERFRRFFWEFRVVANRWRFLQSTINEAPRLYGGLESLIDWQDNGAALARRQGGSAWGKRGIMVSQMNALPAALFLGEAFDSNASPLVPNEPGEMRALWTFVSSQTYHDEVRKVDQSVKPTNTSLVQVPFDLAHWQQVGAEKYPNGLPKPHSDDPTQWLFNGHPKGSEQTLHVAIARLLGYRWPRQTGSSFPDCPALELDGLERFADEDGIVCLTSLRGEANATDRLRELLGAALGSFDERQLVATAGKKGSKSKFLDDWLRDEFFEQHCDLFHQRPFIWHLWDGHRDGFHALVNYHQLTAPNGGGRRTLESLTYGYLGDWIGRQRDAVKAGESGADDRLAASLELQGMLAKILAGEHPYDLFIRWKPLHQQPIGWEPDLNDGVRLNARPFLATDLSRGKKGAGLFRSKVNLNWSKDRGNEPERSREDYPWFWNAGEFAGIRVNDVHLTNAEKEAARKRVAASQA